MKEYANGNTKESIISKTYKTKELALWQKILQVYWVNPKSWLLDEFTITDDIVTVRVKSGKVISAPIDQIKVKVQRDSYARREVYLSHNTEKLHFKEIPWMLTEEQWDQVIEIFNVSANSNLAKTAWALSIAEILMR